LNAQLFTLRAQQELEDAAVWIYQDNPEAAEALLTAAERAAQLLQANPFLGRSLPDLAPEPYRFWLLRGFPYLLVYDAVLDPPMIVRVVHRSRELPAALDE